MPEPVVGADTGGRSVPNGSSSAPCSSTPTVCVAMSMPPSPSPKRLSRWVHTLAIIAILGIGNDISGVMGWRARQLQLPFAWVTYLTPLLGVGAYIFVGQLLSRTKLGRWAWGLGYVAGGLLLSTPVLLEATYARPIALARWLDPGEKAELNAKFPHPYVEYSATSEGIRLLIRRSDYDPSLVQFLRSIHALPDA